MKLLILIVNRSEFKPLLGWGCRGVSVAISACAQYVVGVNVEGCIVLERDVVKAMNIGLRYLHTGGVRQR